MSKSWPSSVTDTVFTCARWRSTDPAPTLKRSRSNICKLLYRSHSVPKPVLLEHNVRQPRDRRHQPAYLVYVEATAYINCYLSSLDQILFTLVQAPTLSNNRHLPTTTAMKLTIPALLALIASAVALPQWVGPPNPGLRCLLCQKSCTGRRVSLHDCMKMNCGQVRYLALMTARRNAELISILVRPCPSRPRASFRRGGSHSTRKDVIEIHGSILLGFVVHLNGRWSSSFAFDDQLGT